ncbi:MAG TPA: CHRD domain-containing protein [Vicinamibacterales bacterium]
MNHRVTVLLLAATAMLAIPGTARPDDHRPERRFRAALKGRNEVPLTLSAARGSLTLRVNDDDSSVHFVLEYSGIQTTVLFAHIHVGQPDVNGGVTVFFCGGGGRPACPQSGTVEGDFTAADVIGLPTQQLEANNLEKVLKAIRAGKTYANVHSMTSMGGEIRGQIGPDDNHW